MSQNTQSSRRSHNAKYLAYIQSPEWRAKRVEYQKARPWFCACCGRPGPLHLHHRTYQRLGDELLDDLIPLCRACHLATHDFIHEQAEQGVVIPLYDAHELWWAVKKMTPVVRLKTVRPKAPPSHAARRSQSKKKQKKQQKPKVIPATTSKPTQGDYRKHLAKRVIDFVGGEYAHCTPKIAHHFSHELGFMRDFLNALVMVGELEKKGDKWRRAR